MQRIALQFNRRYIAIWRRQHMSIKNINRQWKYAFHALKKEQRSIIDKLGLSKVDANILMALDDGTGKTKAEVAEILSFTPSSLTRSLDRLCEHNLVERKIPEHDRRFIELSLTQKGKHIINQYNQLIEEPWRHILKNLTTNEIEQLENLLNKINETEGQT